MRLAVLVVLAFALAGARSAAAGGAGTNDVACGSVAASWSAPRGAIVSIRRDDVVTAITDSAGEYRTHVMLSHGVGTAATHAASHTPGTNGWPIYCSRPLRANELEHGYPGASRVEPGGLYTYLNQFARLEYAAYTLAPDGVQRTRAEETADTAWYGLAKEWVPSVRDPNQGFYVLSETGEDHACAHNHYAQDSFLWCTPFGNGSGNGCDCGCQWADPDCRAGDFHRLEYSMFQYHDIEGRQLGAGNVTNNGVQCASLPAALYHQQSGDSIAPHAYGHATSMAAISAIYWNVVESCQDGLGMWRNIGSAFSCAEVSICDDAARQVRNCFIDPRYCDTDSDQPWTAVQADPAAQAMTISPDVLLGTSGHPGAPHANVGPWAGQADAPLTWSSGGNVYGCWF